MFHAIRPYSFVVGHYNISAFIPLQLQEIYHC